MKFRNLFFTMLAILAIAGCAKEDPIVEVEDVETLKPFTAKAAFGLEDDVWYEGIIDHEQGTVLFNIPYYLSDTEEIQGDLTKMYVKAKFPSLAVVEPKFTNVEVNLLEGVNVKMTLRDNHFKNYRIYAQYVKSDKKDILAISNPAKSKFVIEAPENGQEGKITYLKNTRTVTDKKYKDVKLQLVPWATIESECLNEKTGLLDLKDGAVIKVVAQNGDADTYRFGIDNAALAKEGTMGPAYNLFGFQTTKEATHGFVQHANRNMAVVGNYLILSNVANYKEMVVIDRFSGKTLDKKVNTEGMEEDLKIHAVCQDDAGHLVAVSFVFNNETYGTPNKNFGVYVWDKGIEQKPTKIFYKNVLEDPFFETLRATSTWAPVFDLGRTVSISGDIMKGDAVMALACGKKLRPVFMTFKDGKVQGTAEPIWNAGTSVLQSMTNACKVLIMNNKAPFKYIWQTQYGTAQGINYFPGEALGFPFQLPDESNKDWWRGGLIGMGYINYNGCQLLGVANSNEMAPTIAVTKLVVSNIGMSPSGDSFIKNIILDSRFGDKMGIEGAGYGEQGCISPWPFDGKSTVIGNNGNGVGDVAFGKTDDFKAVQVYLLVPDEGLLAYEISAYEK